jgi:hypothetical protein
MKKIINLLLLLTIPIISFTQEKVTWDFPVKSDTEEWKTTRGSANRISKCQIPENILKTLSTRDLLDICLKYPLLIDVFAFNDIDVGFEKYENDFNGFRELLTRPDAIDYLFQKYDAIDASKFPKEKGFMEKGDFIYQLSFIELFISHAQILSKTNKTDRRKFVQKLVSQLEIKESKRNWYVHMMKQTTSRAITRYIENESSEFSPNYNKLRVKNYTKFGIPDPEQNVVNEIINSAKAYLKASNK